MSRNIAVLERLGLLTREPSAEDARARLLSITEPGADLARRGDQRPPGTGVARSSAAGPSLTSATSPRLLGQLNDDLA